ncbi:hypothetical protein ACH4U6_22175 [Streptomyces netropsis]|uniref:hypothetical protein n=1 Tax=Streptomyces netropsis TaxID=55404 RepID=UPI0037BB4892
MVRVLVALGAVVALSAPSPPTGSNVPAELRLTAEALGRTQQHGTLLVRVPEKLDFSGGGDIQQGVRKVLEARKDRYLIVDLTGSRHSGEAGTMLLLLANKRVIPDGSAVDSLQKSGEVLQSQQADLCRGDNAKVCDLLRQKEKLDQQAIKRQLHSTTSLAPQDQQHAAKLTLPQNQSVTKPPQKGADAQRPTGSGGGPDPTDVLLIALMALLALIALAVFKTRRPVVTATTGRPLPPGFLLSGAPTSADRPSSVPTGTGTGRPRLAVVRRPLDGPVRTAVVRTCLQPQGYVEFDGWLHRATWAGPPLTPPRPGARVDVVGPESGRLEAFAPGGLGHADGHARGSAPP